MQSIIRKMQYQRKKYQKKNIFSPSTAKEMIRSTQISAPAPAVRPSLEALQGYRTAFVIYAAGLPALGRFMVFMQNIVHRCRTVMMFHETARIQKRSAANKCSEQNRHPDAQC